jgi:hypothetical protein
MKKYIFMAAFAVAGFQVRAANVVLNEEGLYDADAYDTEVRAADQEMRPMNVEVAEVAEDTATDAGEAQIMRGGGGGGGHAGGGGGGGHGGGGFGGGGHSGGGFGGGHSGGGMSHGGGGHVGGGHVGGGHVGGGHTGGGMHHGGHTGGAPGSGHHDGGHVGGHVGGHHGGGDNGGYDDGGYDDGGYPAPRWVACYAKNAAGKTFIGRANFPRRAQIRAMNNCKAVSATCRPIGCR